MATRIRLRKVGRKKQPVFRIVVTDRQNPRDGSFVETLGHYNPRTDPAVLQVDVERARAWLAKGATPSDTVHSLLKRAGVFQAGDVTPVAEPQATADAPAEPAAAPAEPAASADPTDG